VCVCLSLSHSLSFFPSFIVCSIDGIYTRLKENFEAQQEQSRAKEKAAKAAAAALAAVVPPPPPPDEDPAFVVGYPQLCHDSSIFRPTDPLDKVLATLVPTACVGSRALISNHPSSYSYACSYLRAIVSATGCRCTVLKCTAFRCKPFISEPPALNARSCSWRIQKDKYALGDWWSAARCCCCCCCFVWVCHIDTYDVVGVWCVCE